MGAPNLTLPSITAQLHNFQVGALLGFGGQGLVHRARNLTTGRDVALKLYSAPDSLERAEREIQALHNYRHPNMADLLSHGRVNHNGGELPYVEWELIEGEPLDRKILRGNLTNAESCALGRDVCRSIHHIWQKRIVHRDIKPENIMIRVNGEAVLLDLGVARHVDATTLTILGAACGTFGYMSPEQSRAERNLSCLSDVFSLGVVLISALSGMHPTAGNQAALTSVQLNVANLLPMIPASVATLIQRMVALRPAFRPVPLDLATQFAVLAGQV